MEPTRTDLPPNDPDPLVGQIFEDRYRVDAVLGRGGFGAVYKATQLAIGRPVAIKILKAHLTDDPKEVARFQQEARAVAALKHPNIVEIHDFGQTASGSLYLVMDYLEGDPLGALIGRDREPLDGGRILRIAVQTLDALAEAHAHGVVHRDLKPENLFIAREGRRHDVVKLLDFGIAKVSGDMNASDMSLTQTGFAIGSPKYMSPEQCRGKKVTPQSDLYSFGCVLFEALLGALPFREDSPSGYLIAHATQRPVLPTRDGKVPTGPWVDAILACLEKDPAARPESAEALAARLQAAGPAEIAWVDAADTQPVLGALDGPLIHPSPGAETVALPTGLSRSQEARAPRRGWLVAVAALVLIGGGLGAWMAFAGDGRQDGPEIAVTAPATATAAAHAAPPTPRSEPTPAATASPDVTAIAEEADVAPAPAAEPVRFRVTLASDPSGAAVFLGGERVGTTPHAVEWPDGERAPSFVLRLTGYEREEVALDADDDGGTRTVALRRQKPAAGARPTKRPDAPVAEDGGEVEKW